MTSDTNIMNDNNLEENRIDKQKILEKQERNKKLTIGESAMIPYVIMGILLNYLSIKVRKSWRLFSSFKFHPFRSRIL